VGAQFVQRQVVETDLVGVIPGVADGAGHGLKFLTQPASRPAEDLGMETMLDDGPVDPTWVTCCWLAALGMAAGLEGWWPEYWLMRAAEGWRKEALPN
jgi:hypothetical protein